MADSMESTVATEQLRLTDEGLEAPERLVGRTGQIQVELPNIKMQLGYSGEGVREYDPELVTFPPKTDKADPNVPSGHALIDGVLYEIVDDRDLDECPHCGSDAVAACDSPPRCYNCETDLNEVSA